MEPNTFFINWQKSIQKSQILDILNGLSREIGQKNTTAFPTAEGGQEGAKQRGKAWKELGGIPLMTPAGTKNVVKSESHPAKRLMDRSPAPTGEPTKTPTEEPSKSPSEEPTKSPSEEPSKTPTEEPTKTPSEEPTKQCLA